MKRILLAFGVAVGLIGKASAIDFGLYQLDLWKELKYQVFEQTKLTIHKSGGAAGFYDLSTGNDYSLKQGLLSHVITNRFLAASVGWYSADNQSGVIVGGPTVKLKGLIETVVPELKDTIPGILKPLDIGANYGWGTDNSQHYGFHVMWDFGAGTNTK